MWATHTYFGWVYVELVSKTNTNATLAGKQQQNATIHQELPSPRPPSSAVVVVKWFSENLANICDEKDPKVPCYATFTLLMFPNNNVHL